MRKLNQIDRFILHVDHALRTVLNQPHLTERANPALEVAESELDEHEKKHAAALMRVNHAGEVAAQGLYQGQGITARRAEVRNNMRRAALEENDHLDWCQNRIKQLGGHTSYLSPVWYAGSFALGALAGSVGDKWSLGFIVETEHQVIKHLDKHLHRLPANDTKSRAIIEQMRLDEKKHAANAARAGAAPLPKPVKFLMRQTAKVMTGTAYFI